MSSQTVTSPPLSLEREPVEGACPQCDSANLARYPVYSEGGWFDAVKCQDCLTSISRERGPLLGPLQLLVDQL